MNTDFDTLNEKVTALCTVRRSLGDKDRRKCVAFEHPLLSIA